MTGTAPGDPAAGVPRTVQLFLASTYLETAFLAAALDAGLYGDADERVLLASSSSVVLELATPLPEAEGIRPLLSRFDRVIDLNETIEPMHPHQFAPVNGMLPMMQRLLRETWRLGDARIELILESPQVNPAIALARIFHSAPVRVYADGLMGYGPTRNRLPLGVLQRIVSVDSAPLVDGLAPRLLHEASPEYREIPLRAVRAVVTELAEAHDFRLPPPAPGTALLLGQYLSALELIDEQEEAALHGAMVDAAAARGLRRLVFKPHPAAPPGVLGPLQDAAARHDVELEVLDSPAIAEIAMERLQPELVVSCFSTGLATGNAVFGIPALAVGTDQVLAALAPYGNSNRIPLTIVDLLWGGAPAQATALGLQQLVDAVSYCMQAAHLADLEPQVRTTLGLADPDIVQRYFKRRRLMKLGLPGGLETRRVGAVRAAGRLARFSAGRLGQRLQSPGGPR